jgi:inosine/xanthosine triphosphatase
MKKIIVASKNPVKINSTLKAFKKMIPNEEFVIESLSVPSNVSDQPMTDEETLTGAINRVSNLKLEATDFDYFVGVEGGVEEIEDNMYAFAWIVIANNEYISKSRTADFLLPSKITELVKSGVELGIADDIVFGRTNSKQENGTVGQLTKNVIDRESYYEHAAILALIPFVNRELYFT